tara:strand:+ start:1507 stop:1770 length:264 start_codon:yes stop_codon:yes gene_type:complete
MNYSNRTYAFIETSDIGSVDFSQVMETSATTVRKSIDETQFILKWSTLNWPSFIAPSGSITPTWKGSHTECINLLTGSFWTPSGSIP